MVHFDLSELDAGKGRVVRFAHYAYKAYHVPLVWNFLTWVILAIAGAPGAGVGIVYSIFDLIIFPAAALYAFYSGYKGIATNNPANALKYQAVSAVLIFFALIFSIVSGDSGMGANLNGWTGIARASAAESAGVISGGLKGFWIFAAVVEALMWTVNVGLGGFALLKVREFHGGKMKSAIAKNVAMKAVGV